MSKPYLGIIEGFFGRSWSFTQRKAYASFLKSAGYDFYIYAPKSDPHLRKAWQSNWPSDTEQDIRELVGAYQSQDLDFGVGLSPFEIYTNYDRSAQKHLKAKIDYLNQFGIDMLCLLFDDMRGDQADLAKVQVQISCDVQNWSRAKKIIMCPTYYSFDPVLEKVFGKRPKGYFQDLGQGLPSDIDIFWTGPQVCSKEYSESHLKEVIETLGRKPFLWDNYPVNDGAKISKFLHLKPFKKQEPALAQLTTGHAANPMNQAWLSRLPLLSLPQSYQAHPSTLTDLLKSMASPPLAQAIAEDIDCFQEIGLDLMEDGKKQSLLKKYQNFDSPYAAEICDWLQGEYAFDPACLTD